MLYDTPNPTSGKEHFGGAQYALSNFGLDTDMTVYTGVLALAVNLLVVVLGSLALRALGVPHGDDETVDGDYVAEAGDPGTGPLEPTPEAARA
jgi:SSS family solute:Na+ symporter